MAKRRVTSRRGAGGFGKSGRSVSRSVFQSGTGRWRWRVVAMVVLGSAVAAVFALGTGWFSRSHGADRASAWAPGAEADVGAPAGADAQVEGESAALGEDSGGTGGDPDPVDPRGNAARAEDVGARGTEPEFLTRTELDESNNSQEGWGTDGVGLHGRDVPKLSASEIGAPVRIDGREDLQSRGFQPVNPDKAAISGDLEGLGVAVLPMDPGLQRCVDYDSQKSNLGGWDYTLHLFFEMHAVPVAEADFLFVPFYQFGYQNKKNCVTKGVMQVLSWELKRASEYLDAAGRAGTTTLVVPMSHDFGGCANYNINGYAQNMPYFEPLRAAIVLQANGDFDMNCFDRTKDVVVPAFSTFPGFDHRANSLAAVFGDPRSVRRASERTTLLFAGFSRDFSQRRPGTRAWLLDEANWKDPSRVRLKKAPKFPQYVQILNETAFCLIPPGVVGWTGRIWESVYAGCIPAIIAENTLFPFEDVIEYAKFTVRIDFEGIEGIEDRLNAITPEERDELQAEALRVRANFKWPRVDELASRGAQHPSPIDHVLRELKYAKARLHPGG